MMVHGMNTVEDIVDLIRNSFTSSPHHREIRSRVNYSRAYFLYMPDYPSPKERRHHLHLYYFMFIQQANHWVSDNIEIPYSTPEHYLVFALHFPLMLSCQLDIVWKDEVKCWWDRDYTVKTGPEDVFEKVFTEDVFAPKDSRCKTLFPRKML